jgi:hypothetical protein
MFNSDFYPTPLEAIKSMGFNPEGKIILEPSAGKGDIVDYCFDNGAKKVIAYESDTNLRKILKDKCLLFGDDFLSANGENLSHIDMIVMNPPFRNADEHILKAWEVAPSGCEIYALCNYETINKDYFYSELNALIRGYGTSENLGDCFSTAERKTNVEVALIKLVKPNTDGEDFYTGFFMGEDDEEEKESGPGLMEHNEVRAMVNRYVGTLKVFDQLAESLVSLNYMTSQIGMSKSSISVGYNDTFTTRDEFLKKLQKDSWGHIFKKLNMGKYVTSGVMKDVNKFIETQEKVPFTMKNIYRMIEIIIGTREDNFNRALIEAVDNFTQHTSENRFGVEGWKTNSGHMLNKKFIVENIMENNGYSPFTPKYDSYQCDRINDLNKVLCNVMGYNFNNIGEIYFIKNIIGTITPNTWYDWGFFEVKFFKKGTMHLKFKEVDTWYRLNAAYGKLKGFSLPETYKK